MEFKCEMKGVCVPMVTPMTEEEDVDYNSLENLTEYLIKEGADTLYPCGTTGETIYLTPEERIKVVRTTIKAANHKVPVFAQVGGCNTRISRQLAEEAISDGADGLGILTPIYYHMSEDEMFRYYSDILAVVPENVPVYLYGIPFCAANQLSFETVSGIAESFPNVRGIKYSVGDVLTLMQFMKIRNGSFHVLVAPAQMLLPALAAGVNGIVSGTCNIFASEIKDLMKTFESGDIKKCQNLQKKVGELATLIAVKEVQCCKSVLVKRKVIRSDNVRSPRIRLTEAEKTELFKQFNNC